MHKLFHSRGIPPVFQCLQDVSPRSLTSDVLCDGRSSRLNRTTSPNRLSQSGSRKFVALRHRLCQPNCSANYPFGHRVAQTDNRVYFSALKHDEKSPLINPTALCPTPAPVCHGLCHRLCHGLCHSPHIGSPSLSQVFLLRESASPACVGPVRPSSPLLRLSP